MANDLNSIPKTPSDAPSVINLPDGVFKAAMDEMWGKSYYIKTGYRTQSTLPTKTPDVRECGFTVFKDRGTQEMRSLNHACSNSQGSDAGSTDAQTGFQPDLDFPDKKYKAVGFVHSHPGIISKTLVKSLDATDAGRMLRDKLDFVMIVTGSGVVELYLRTRRTKQGFEEPVNADWVNKNMTAGQIKLNEIAKRAALGDEWQKSSEKTAMEVAEHYSLAFYRGSGGLLLNRIWPPNKPTQKPPSSKPNKAASPQR